MKIWFDTEFIECGATETVKLLSLAFVASNDAALYVVITDAPRDEANEFVVEHVLPYVDVPPFAGDAQPGIGVGSGSGLVTIQSEGNTQYVRCPRAASGALIAAWVAERTPTPEFWAWYGAYDWVGLAQLFGNMTDLPKNWPMFVRDLRQEAGGITWPDNLNTGAPAGLPAHHALADAYELRARHRWALHSGRVA